MPLRVYSEAGIICPLVILGLNPEQSPSLNKNYSVIHTDQGEVSCLLQITALGPVKLRHLFWREFFEKNYGDVVV